MLGKLISDERFKRRSATFFGACTTLVNFLMFALLKDGLRIELNVSNTVAVAASISVRVYNKQIVRVQKQD